MTPDQERDYLLDHVRNPRNMGEIAGAEGVGECKNPACGDLVRVTLKDSSSLEIKIKATGCTICIATASLMSEVVKKKSSAEARELAQVMRASMRPGSEWPQALSLLEPLKRMRESPMKVPCTLVGWVALEKALENMGAQ